jgi:hypothetical protein
MATAKKPTTKSRAVVGSAKKSKGGMKFTKRFALFALTGILAFSVILGLGWQQWQVHQFKAHAAGLACLQVPSNTGGICVQVCKTYAATGYGPVWRNTWYINKGGRTDIVNTSVDTWASGGLQSSRSFNGWWAGSYQQFDSSQSSIDYISQYTQVSMWTARGAQAFSVTFESNNALVNPALNRIGPNQVANCQ